MSPLKEWVQAKVSGNFEQTFLWHNLISCLYLECTLDIRDWIGKSYQVEWFLPHTWKSHIYLKRWNRAGQIYDLSFAKVFATRILQLVLWKEGTRYPCFKMHPCQSSLDLLLLGGSVMVWNLYSAGVFLQRVFLQSIPGLSIFWDLRVYFVYSYKTY